MRVAALFTRPGSVYAELGADCYDAKRDARTFDLACPVVAHPPCRAWGQYAHWAKPRRDERDLAWWAMHVVRHCGGVLEHPITSRLWHEAGCLTAGLRDEFGGVLVTVEQGSFGHRAAKATGLYVVGRSIPELPWFNAPPTRPVEQMGRAEREATPRPFAAFLINLARAA